MGSTCGFSLTLCAGGGAGNALCPPALSASVFYGCLCDEENDDHYHNG